MLLNILSTKIDVIYFGHQTQKKDQLACELVFFQLNPPLAEEIHLRWMKSLRDEICLAAGEGGGFNFI